MSWPTLKSSCSSRHVPVQRFAAQSALKSLLGGGLMLIAAQVVGGDDMQPKVKVDDSSFKCITEMTPVRHFYVDNLLGNLTETVAIAQVGKGEYPEGSVLQLMERSAGYWETSCYAMQASSKRGMHWWLWRGPPRGSGSRSRPMGFVAWLACCDPRRLQTP